MTGIFTPAYSVSKRTGSDGLGLNPEVRNGYQRITVRFTIALERNETLSYQH
jgi:hypothetical protein